MTRVINIKVSDSLYDRLVARKRETGCFVSEFVRRSIKFSLDQEDLQDAQAALVKQRIAADLVSR